VEQTKVAAKGQKYPWFRRSSIDDDREAITKGPSNFVFLVSAPEWRTEAASEQLLKSIV
jgi:hypothetical protein